MTSVALWVWGGLVGMDLVAVGQFMVSRPLVAGVGAGLVAGDVAAGMAVGLVLELFALDVLPVGAVRYPDYGIGAVAGVATAAGAPDLLSWGLAVLVGLTVAEAGGVGMHLVRIANARLVRARAGAVAAGDVRAIRTLHRLGLVGDGIRAFGVAAIGLLLAAAVEALSPVTLRGALAMSVVAVGVALGTAVAGAARLAVGGAAVKWLLGGLVLGSALAGLR